MPGTMLDIPTVMRAQVLESFGSPYKFCSVPVPEVGDTNDLLIKVTAASYCHTDAVLAAGLLAPNSPRSLPHVGCHEFAGVVVAVGTSAAARRFDIGDRVGVPGRAYHPCGECVECTTTDCGGEGDGPGYSAYCRSAFNNGVSRDGGFREYATVDARQVAPLPDGLSDVEAAPLMCAGLTVYEALRKARLVPGNTVGIMGCGGGLGHLGLQFASKMGFKVVVGVDAADGPLALAKELQTGAMLVDARTTTAQEVKELLRRQDVEGLDAVLVLPESPTAFDYGVKLLRNHGTCVVVSFPEEPFRISGKDLVFRDISVIGSLVGSNKSLRAMLDFAVRYHVRAITKTFPLERLNELVIEYHKGLGGQ
ncbi:hypothetical protein LTR06_010864 [Exophiala xenobiotica]|nr:hypothetical protein LTR06_010864 [Exophiala xenobiotica]